MDECVKVFGKGALEAVLARQAMQRGGKVHLPTLQAVLDVLGIPNVAEQEALTAAREAATNAAVAENEAKEIIAKDEVDQKRTDEAVANLRATRQDRAILAKFASDKERSFAAAERIENKRLEGLARMAKKMTS